MGEYRPIDSSLVHYFGKIQVIAEKFEADLIASGRFEYLRTAGNKKIYVEKATGHEVPVIIPLLAKKQIPS
jgi:hypothetical protein